MLSQQNIPEVDVLLVGAGFGAFTTLNKLRKQGLNVRIWEKGASSGGIWYWNQYPGARVDSDTPIYQLFDEELYKNFTFTERYAGWQELKRYFEFVENKWNIKPHVDYNHNLEHAQFDEQRRQWLCEASNGNKVYCTWFMPAIGFAAKKYTPPIPGLSDFKGEVYHTATWPQWGVNLRKKKIAVIGTGASGIQTIQETGPDAEHLTVFQRTPNFCLPMNQSKLIPEVEERKKNQGEYQKNFDTTWTTFAGFQYDFSEKNTFDDTPEEREAFFQKIFNEEGGFRFWLKTYKDMLFDQKANDEAYNFWRKEVHKRVSDKEKAELLAPAVKPHPWGTKRPSLEQNFYEVVSLPHVDIVDLNKDPIVKVSGNSIETEGGKTVDVDIIILATGFDAVTGSLGQLDIRGTDNRTIKDHWADGLKSSMGIALNKFPNMFFLYGPQAPTAFSNGPTCTQAQAFWIDKTIAQLRKDHITRIEAKEEAEKDWTRQCHEVWDVSLFPQAKSWYSGANIPGKKVEPLNWAGGMPRYIKSLNDSLENNYQGWSVAS